MAMSHLAPMDNPRSGGGYKRKYWWPVDRESGDIHAVRRFRDRGGALARDKMSLSEEALANWLDNVISQAAKDPDLVETFLGDEDGKPFQLVNLEPFIHEPLLVQLKPEEGKPKEYNQRVTTIFTFEMRENSVRSKKWTKPNGTLGTKIAAALAVTPPPPKPGRPGAPGPQPNPELRLITYTKLPGGEKISETYTREYLTDRLSDLHADKDATDILVWKPVLTKVKIVVEEIE
jgi:hypothetical protein